jgi:hypothetical protein
MKFVLIVALAFAVIPACKSSKKPDDMQHMKKEAPDAKPTLCVAEDDARYVATKGSSGRQMHYYSRENDTTYVIAESSGKVVTTFKGRQMPGVVVVDKPAYQPPPLEKKAAAEPAKEEVAAKEGCGSGEIEEVETGAEGSGK